MKYGHEIDRVELIRDCYAEQFAEPGDLKYNFIVKLYGSTIIEEHSPQKLGKELKRIAKRLDSIANFLLKMKGRRWAK